MFEGFHNPIEVKFLREVAIRRSLLQGISCGIYSSGLWYKIHKSYNDRYLAILLGFRFTVNNNRYQDAANLSRLLPVGATSRSRFLLQKKSSDPGTPP